jgi:hypothetical protein
MLSKAEAKSLLTKLQAAKEADNHIEIEKLNNEIAKKIGFGEWPKSQLQIDPNNPDNTFICDNKGTIIFSLEDSKDVQLLRDFFP